MSHEHEWHFIHGAGAGITCAIGDGQQYDSVILDDDFARTLDRIHHSLGRAESSRVLTAALTPETGLRAHTVFSLTDADPPMSPESFRYWYDNCWERLNKWEAMQN